ncbi:MAG TPA: CDP-alcohol phosphatidyltransferase family protein [Bacteroidota bacterium]|nr:CDP-alcohol phosphatidyltransferase family protein [Bacteroidota bacterium]
MAKSNSQDDTKIIHFLFKDRDRSDILKNPERKAVAFLVQRIPGYISPNMLTFIGFLGSIVVTVSFALATFVHQSYLLIGILGFALNWFGDSLDGRLAYFRNKPRKWYGFVLDITIDWLTSILIGIGYIIYVDGFGEWFGFAFVVLYGWAMITTLLRYKVTNQYSIDSGILGPTEVRLIICLLLLSEVLFKNSIVYLTCIACCILFTVNIINTFKLLRDADAVDKENNRLSKEPPTNLN